LTAKAHGTTLDPLSEFTSFGGGIKKQSRVNDYSNGLSSPESNVKDFIKRNIGKQGKDKSHEFERQRALINRVYQRITKRKDYVLDLVGLNSIQSYLPPKLKNEFYQSPIYQEIFSETNVLNQAFISITDLVSCYRIELGQML